MAFVDSIDDTLKREIKNKLCINDNDFNTILEIFTTKILPLIEKNYLSHLKTAIEDTVNDRMKAELLNQIKRDSAISSEEKNLIEKSLKLNQFRPFTILLKPVICKKKAFTRIINRSAFIGYDNRLPKKEIRILLAHEFGHIIISECYSDSQLRNEQNNADLFAFFAILDKDKFYKSEAQKLTHISDIELINDIVSLREKD